MPLQDYEPAYTTSVYEPEYTPSSEYEPAYTPEPTYYKRDYGVC